MRMQQIVVASILGVFSTFPLATFSAQATELTDTAVHDTYIGFNPLAASRGASLEESRVQFSLDGNGITLLQPVAVGGAVYNFSVHYSPEWAFHLKGWGVDECLALRQHRTSNLAQLIFCFTPRFSFAKHDVTMILGEGMPVPLGVFVRQGKGLGTLAGLYTKEYRPAPKQAVEQSWLVPIDVKAGKIIMTVGDREAKIKFLRDAEVNMWTGSTSEIQKRLEFAGVGLADPDPSVQIAALSMFELSGRVTGGVALVADVLKRHQSLRHDVLEKALSAAACLLYETYYFNKERFELAAQFGTTDIAAIHKSSGGRLTPEQAKLVEEVARPITPERTWTREHQELLLGVIARVLAESPSLSDYARKEGERALRDYALPTR